MFKRLYWSGSRVQLHFIVWPGAETQMFSAFTPDYHVNVINAFNAAPALAAYLQSLDNRGLKVTTGAHSLGNMVVSSALWDHEIGRNIVDRHLAIDAALATEALDGSVPVQTAMVPAEWYDHATKTDVYPASTRPSEWYNLFAGRSPVDRRDELTWRDRFNNLHNRYPHRDLLIDRWWNFYSSGEEVLRNSEDNTTFVNLFTHTQNNERLYEVSGQFGWAIQEKIKGLGPETGSPYRGLSALVGVPVGGLPGFVVKAAGAVGSIAIPYVAEKMGGTYGGWKFNDSGEYWGSGQPDKQSVVFAWNLGMPQIFRAHPVFDKGPAELSFLYDPDPYNEHWLPRARRLFHSNRTQRLQPQQTPRRRHPGYCFSGGE